MPTAKNRPPEFVVLAGPNGAGKSTVAALMLPKHLEILNFVNADMIAAQSPGLSEIEAGRRALARMDELVEERTSFAFETTLANRSLVRRLAEAQTAGYVVDLGFVSVDDVELSIERVRNRVAEGGHDIPEATIRRRFERGLANFFSLYRPVVDNWAVWDNSSSFVPVAHGGRSRATVVLDAHRWSRIRERGGCDGRDT